MGIFLLFHCITWLFSTLTLLFEQVLLDQFHIIPSGIESKYIQLWIITFQLTIQLFQHLNLFTSIANIFCNPDIIIHQFLRIYTLCMQILIHFIQPFQFSVFHLIQLTENVSEAHLTCLIL